MSVRGLQLSFNQLTARDLPLAAVARAASGCGFEGLGVLPSTVDSLGVPGVRSVLDGEGLRPTSICALVGLAGSGPGTSGQRMTRAGRCLEYAAELGVPLVVVVGGPSAGVTRQEAWDQAAGALGALLRQAARAGVTILLEPLHPVLIGQSVATSLADALELISGNDLAGVVVDTWHVWWDSRLRPFLRDSGERVGLVHLSDWPASPAAHLDRVLPGDGVADLSAICADLIRTGFGGWWEVEVLSEQLWAGDQLALVRACHRAATVVLSRALALASGHRPPAQPRAAGRPGAAEVAGQ
jgi:sugar phosphate isomerase/epimerase